MVSLGAIVVHLQTRENAYLRKYSRPARRFSRNLGRNLSTSNQLIQTIIRQEQVITYREHSSEAGQEAHFEHAERPISAAVAGHRIQSICPWSARALVRSGSLGIKISPHTNDHWTALFHPLELYSLGNPCSALTHIQGLDSAVPHHVRPHPRLALHDHMVIDRDAPRPESPCRLRVRVRRVVFQGNQRRAGLGALRRARGIARVPLPVRRDDAGDGAGLW